MSFSLTDRVSHLQHLAGPGGGIAYHVVSELNELRSIDGAVAWLSTLATRKEFANVGCAIRSARATVELDDTLSEVGKRALNHRIARLRQLTGCEEAARSALSAASELSLIDEEIFRVAMLCVPSESTDLASVIRSGRASFELSQLLLSGRSGGRERAARAVAYAHYAQHKAIRRRPPRGAELLFYVFTSRDACDALVGDLEERYKLIHKKFGHRRADFWYWTQTVTSMRPIVWAWGKQKALKPVVGLAAWALAKGLVGHDSWLAALLELWKRVRS